MQKPMTVLGVKIERATRERLKALAGKRDRTPHWLARKAITEFVEREERAERERSEDEARWRSYVETGEFISEPDMDRWLRALQRGKQIR
jgi:predicted transcriptional regulator